MKFLIVAGVFDDNGGRPSGLIKKIYTCLKKYENNIDIYNGGNFDDIASIYQSTKNYDTVLWMPHIDNNKQKIRNVKEVNPFCTLIMSKRNDNKYTFQEILNRCIIQKANLMIEFSQAENGFKMRLFDPLGALWYDGNSVEDFVDAFYKRLSFIKTTTRVPTFKHDDKTPIPNFAKDFFTYVNNWSKVFYSLIKPADEVSRFLGNISFRNLPNQDIENKNNFIVVSERNADKTNINYSNFVCAKKFGDKVYYYGNKKPSRDTAIQYEFYKLFPNINYILHVHTYVYDGIFTHTPVPCGSWEEIEEIKNIVKDYNKSIYKFNLKGHGCLIFTSLLKDFDNIIFMERKLPEKIH